MSAILVSGSIFTVTVSACECLRLFFLTNQIFKGHAQDFRDRSGDALLGRKTIPLILTQGVARWSLLLFMFAFTYGLILLWEPPPLIAAGFILVCIITTVKFVANYSEEEDRKSFRWYEASHIFSFLNLSGLTFALPQIWLICAHILPIFKRVSNGEISSPFAMDLNWPGISA
jgi:4-hydroxybenzoate polyprenyltransferase